MLIVGVNLLFGESPAAIAAVMNRTNIFTVVLADDDDPDQRALAGLALKAGAARVLPPMPPPSADDFVRAALRLYAILQSGGSREPSADARDTIQGVERPSRARSREQPPRPMVIALASSTGGPRALHELLAALPADFPLPVLSVQHIVRGLVDDFVNVLAANCRIRVKLAEDGEPLIGTTAYIAPDDWHLEVAQPRDNYAIGLSAAEPVEGFRPSASILFASIAHRFGAGALAVVLTGMGTDGISGLVEVRRAGGFILTQDESSSANYGMPGAVAEAGLSDLGLPLADIAAYLTGLV